MRAAQLLKEAAHAEAALPLARLITDPENEVQLEAIAAELNIFLAEKIVPRKRVGFVIEVRNKISSEAAFSAGPLALGARSVPFEVLTALRTASRDEHPRVALEALYAFGTLAAEPQGAARREVLRTSAPDLAAMIGAPDPALRFAALRVIARLFERRLADSPVEETLGDAVIVALNEGDRAIRSAAMHALGAMRYERAIQALTELFEYYSRGEFAEATLDALAHIAHESSLPLLSSQLASKSVALKGIAIEGLARAGDRTKLVDIQSALARERSENLLLTGAFAAVLLSNAPVDALAEGLTRPKLRDQARGYLIEVAPGRSSAFSRHVQDPDARVRAEIADTLGLAGDPAALPLVEPMTKDGDPQVVAAAERAVARLRAAWKMGTGVIFGGRTSKTTPVPIFL